MANYKLILPFVAKFEGGLSSDPKDSCSSLRSDVIDPKNGLGYHTNKGVCYKTWVSVAKELGFSTTGKAFVNMTQAQWELIVKNNYWNPLNLDKVNSQSIAEILFQSAWGSGLSGSAVIVRYLQSLLNVAQTGKMDAKTIAAVNNATKTKEAEKNIFQKVWDRRLQYLKSLKSWSTYGNGWSKRMNELLNRGLEYISTGGGYISIGAILLMVGACIYYNKV